MQRSKGAAWGNRKTREYRVWSIEYRERHYFGWQVAASGGGWREDAELKGRPETGQLAGEKSPGLRSRLIGYQVRVFWYGYGCRPEPVPGVEYLNPGPDGRDPGPGRIENQSVIDSVIRHRLSHLLFNSALHSVLNAVLHSVLLSASPPPFPSLPRAHWSSNPRITPCACFAIFMSRS
jgi:hypothetical protein